MTLDAKRLHLIERAALRLDQAAAWAPAAPASDMPHPDMAMPLPAQEEALPFRKPADRPATERAAALDAAALRRAGTVDWEAPDGRVSEEIRIVQTEILRRGAVGAPSAGSRGRLVMVTSAVAREGKSFAAINVAVGIARQGDCRVLLVDADGRVGSLAARFGLGAAPGLLDLAADRALDPAQLTVPSCIAGLEFLPFGEAAKSSEAPGGGAAGAIEAIARRFPDRLVLIDTPPCLSSSRPHLLAPLVGQAVLVVAAGSTQEGDVDAALGLLRSCPEVSLLLNKVRPWHAHSYGSYAHAI
ncbi:MAG TPA: hypothetical protein VJR70_00135 [Stellaceae bacterium]|nr:hypothetical protein [Stellaceae bacterium]